MHMLFVLLMPPTVETFQPLTNWCGCDCLQRVLGALPCFAYKCTGYCRITFWFIMFLFAHSEHSYSTAATLAPLLRVMLPVVAAVAMAWKQGQLAMRLSLLGMLPLRKLLLLLAGHVLVLAQRLAEAAAAQGQTKQKHRIQHPTPPSDQRGLW